MLPQNADVFIYRGRLDLGTLSSAWMPPTTVVETPVEARAGFLDRPVLFVLVVSVALALAALALSYAGVF